MSMNPLAIKMAPPASPALFSSKEHIDIFTSEFVLPAESVVTAPPLDPAEFDNDVERCRRLAIHRAT